MLPPLMSSTLSSADLKDLGSNKSGNTSQTSNPEGGRPPKEEGELSEKTIQNKESTK